LDMSGPVQVTLHETLAPPERCFGFPYGAGVALGDVSEGTRDLQAPAAPTVGGLDRDREAVFGGEGQDVFHTAYRFRSAGDQGRADAPGQVTGGDLVAQRADRGGGRT